MCLKAIIKSAFRDPSGLTIPRAGFIGPTDITLSGRDCIEIVGCKGLTLYENCRISVAIKEGVLTVRGEDLSLKTYCGAQIAVCGRIAGVDFEDV